MKLLHQKAGLTAKFLVDFYETHDWTVFPTSSVTHASNSTLGNLLQFSMSAVKSPLIIPSFAIWVLGLEN